MQAIDISGSRSGDAPILPELLNQIPERTSLSARSAPTVPMKGLPRRNCGARCPRRHTCAQERAALDGEHTRCSSQERNPSRHPPPWPHYLATLELLLPKKPGRNKDAVFRTAWRARHGARLRQAGGRIENQGRDLEPLHGLRNAPNSTHGMSLPKGMGNSTTG